MCGRYTLHTKTKALEASIRLALPDEYAPDYNIGPGREVLAVVNRSKATKAASMMHWGLKTPQNFHINARIETADTTPRFRDSWHGQRCLLPADGFYEWYRDGIRKQAYYIFPKVAAPVFLAGLWFSSSNSEYPANFVILTTEARSPVSEIHARMPVIFEQDAGFSWLDHGMSKQEAQSVAGEINLEHHAVSSRVNSVANKDSRLIEAISPLTDDQLQLF